MSVNKQLFTDKWSEFKWEISEHTGVSFFVTMTLYLGGFSIMFIPPFFSRLGEVGVWLGLAIYFVCSFLARKKHGSKFLNRLEEKGGFGWVLYGVVVFSALMATFHVLTLLGIVPEGVFVMWYSV